MHPSPAGLPPGLLPAAVSEFDMSLWWSSTQRNTVLTRWRAAYAGPLFFGRRGVDQGAGLSVWSLRGGSRRASAMDFMPSRTRNRVSLLFAKARASHSVTPPEAPSRRSGRSAIAPPTAPEELGGSADQEGRWFEKRLRGPTSPGRRRCGPPGRELRPWSEQDRGLPRRLASAQSSVRLRQTPTRRSFAGSAAGTGGQGRVLSRHG